MGRIEFGSELEKENTQERPGGPDPGARGVEALEEEGGKYRETRVEKKDKEFYFKFLNAKFFTKLLGGPRAPTDAIAVLAHW